MTSDKYNGLWLLATFILISIIIASSLVIWFRHDNGDPLTISLSPTPQIPDNVVIINDAYQKVDINRADLWLLQALPNIGEVRAQAIIDYRQKNGPYQTIQDITKVPGISQSTFNKIKELITVSE